MQIDRRRRSTPKIVVERRSLLAALSVSMRFMISGVAAAGLGAALAFSLGDRTTGLRADLAVILTVCGIATVFLAGTLSLGSTAARIWKRRGRLFRD